MTPAAKRKAALFLMQLGPHAAAQLLSAVHAETATEIVAEMALINATGKQDPQTAQETVRGFCTLLRGDEADWGMGFIKQMLDSALGAGQSERAFQKVRDSLDQLDPFGDIRPANVHEIAAALEGEPPQVAAVVLSELPEKSSRELLGLLDESMRNEAVRGMAGATSVPPDTKVRVANGIRRRLEDLRTRGGEEGDARQKQIRKAAVLLRGLGKDAREAMLQSIREHDAETAALLQTMMIVWEDLPLIADRSLQEVLRQADVRRLALALVGSDAATDNKIKQNMSEGAREALFEESELLARPKQREVEEARELLLTDFRELNEAGMLEFEGE